MKGYKEWFESVVDLEGLDPKSLFDRFWSGGLSNELQITEDKVDPEQLRMGVEVEMEHTPDPIVSKKIALDHLAEFPNYYTALEEMESKLEAEQAEVKGKGEKS